jgi:hypothetical protein
MANKSKYDPAILPIILEMGLQGSSQKMIWSKLGISSATARAWREKHADFAEALDLALVHSQAFWESQMLANVENKNFNSRMVEIAVRGQFPSDYKDNREVKQEIKAEVTVDFNKAVDQLLKDLKEAE